MISTLGGRGPDDEEGTDSKDPDGLDGITEEFIVRAVKDAHQDKKHCYHCSSPDHFIRDCPLVKSAREGPNLNHKEEMVLKEGAQSPLGKATLPKALQDGMLTLHTDSLLES